MSFYFTYDAHKIDDLIKEKLNTDKLYPREKYHCTMLYTDKVYTSQDIDSYKTIMFPNHIVKITQISTWYTGKDYVLVAQLENNVLEKYHQAIEKRIGIIENKMFNPHITLQKALKEENLYLPNEFDFLIGQEVILNNFHLVEKKVL